MHATHNKDCCDPLVGTTACSRAVDPVLTHSSHYEKTRGAGHRSSDYSSRAYLAARFAHRRTRGPMRSHLLRSRDRRSALRDASLRERRDSNRSQTCSLATRDWQASNPPRTRTATHVRSSRQNVPRGSLRSPLDSPRRLASLDVSLCEGRDSNPRTSTGADLKSAAFVQTRPPSRGRGSESAANGRFGPRRRSPAALATCRTPASVRHPATTLPTASRRPPGRARFPRRSACRRRG